MEIYVTGGAFKLMGPCSLHDLDKLLSEPAIVEGQEEQLSMSIQKNRTTQQHRPDSQMVKTKHFCPETSKRIKAHIGLL